MYNVLTRCLVVVSAMAFGATAHATIYTVGNGAACSHGTIQSALDAAASHAGADEIRLTRSLTYEPESNTVTTNDDLSIVGGFATCDQATSDGIHTVVSGLGASGTAVFGITANGSSIVKLRHLDIKNGDVGVAFNGDGVLQTIETVISNNHIHGISAGTSGSTAELVIDTGTLILNNGINRCFFLGLYYGGGISLEGAIEMTMTAPQTMIAFNSACRGGGLSVGPGAHAYIGSPGYNGLPALYQNVAIDSGGAAWVSGTLKLFTTDPERPIGVKSNYAEGNGGGVYVGGTAARLCAWDFAFEDNTAEGNGAAIYGDSALIVMNYNAYNGCSAHPEAVPCAPSEKCNIVSGNVNSGAETNSELGAAVDLYAANLVANGIVMRDNNGSSVVRTKNGTVSIDECLIADNTTSGALLHATKDDAAADDSLYLKNCTIAGNSINPDSVIRAQDDLYLFNSIIQQPDIPTLNFTGTAAQLLLDSLLLNEGSNAAFGSNSVTGDAQFVAPASGNYRLTRTSPAIDFAAGIVSDPFDLDGNLRDVDLPEVANRSGPRDLGAYEWNPLIINGWFDANLSYWTHTEGAWDGTQSAAGNTGSGSWKVQRDVTPPIDPIRPDSVLGGTFYVGEQCVRLPAAGTFLLNGWGKGGGNALFNDSAVLAWELRKNGGADCSGTADATGELTLSHGAWAQAAHPAVIDVSASDFHRGASTIRVRLVMRSSYPTGVRSVWFDGITLDATYSSDVVFANGFD